MKETLLNTLYHLVLDTTVSQEERQILLNAKKDLETGGYYQRILIQLRNDLTPLTIKNQLSAPVNEFYLTLANTVHIRAASFYDNTRLKKFLKQKN